MDKSGGDGGSADNGGGSVRSIAYQRENLTRFIMHGKLMASRWNWQPIRRRETGEGAGGVSLAIPPRSLGCPSRGVWGDGVERGDRLG